MPNPSSRSVMKPAANTYQGGPKNDRDWYSVSVESVRRTIFLLLFVIAVISGAFAYQQWEQRTRAARAEQMLSEATAVSRELEERSDYEQVRREFFAAWEGLEAGRQAFEEGRYSEALDRTGRSLQEFRRIQQSQQTSEEQRGRFVSVQGNVEYRRGERGTWKRSRTDDALNPGDWVKTSAGGSARVVFPDGSEYTLRANTMVHLTAQTDRFGRSEQVAEMAFGWVELSTQQSNSRVKTPKSEANVRSSSEAMVAFDRERNTSRFATFEGGMDVVAENGQSQFLGALQQSVQVGDLLSEPSSLPGKPRLFSPARDSSFDLASREIRLTWAPVPGATSYSVEVSRSPLFASKIIEDPNRDKTSARLGLRAEGVYYWQVAAVSGDGSRGPWSEARAFRVATMQQASEDDSTPPPISIEDVQTYGSLVIVTGRTEGGARLTINGDEAQVAGDGTFSKSVKVSEEGFVFLEVEAVDASGNKSREQRRVFIDSSFY
jgi:Glucodextranase, domain B/FecR protein